MDYQIDDITKVFSVLPNVQTKLPIPRLRPGQYLPSTPNHQISGVVPVTVRPCVDRWGEPYRGIKPANQFPFQQSIVFNSIGNNGKQIYLANPVYGNLPHGLAWIPFPPKTAHVYPEELMTPVFSKPWHIPIPYIPETPIKIQDDQSHKASASTEHIITDHPKEESNPKQPVESQNLKLTDNSCKTKKRCVKNQKPHYPKCSKNTFVKSMDLVSVEVIHKPSAWLNVTLQVDTSSEMKRGQPVAQYRSIISSVLTELYFPPKLSPPDHLHSDKMAATASYDERGRVTVLEVEFITAGIYKVENTSDRKSGLGKSSKKSVTLTRLESLETLSSKSQYFILGDLCPVPKTFPKCHRNAQTLHKKLIEFMYTREFRKHTLPLLAQVGEEDVWTTALKAPRTRSRASEYDDDQFNKLFVKRKPPSSPNSSNEEKDESQTPKRRRYCRERSPVKRLSANQKTEETPTSQVETALPRRSRRIRGSKLAQPSSDLQISVSPASQDIVPVPETLLEEELSPKSKLREKSTSSGSIVQLPTSYSQIGQLPGSSSSSSFTGESDSNGSSTEYKQSFTSISQPNSPFEPSSPQLDPYTSYGVHIGESGQQSYVPDEVPLCSGSECTSPLTTLSEQTTELLSHLMSTAASSHYSSTDLSTDKIVPSISCDLYPLTTQLRDILSNQNYSPSILDPSNSVTDIVETVLPLEPLDMPELTFWDDLSLPLDLSLPALSSDLPLDLSSKSNRRV